MSKEKTKTIDTKPAKDGVSTKTETKIKKDDNPSTPLPAKQSIDGKDAKTTPSDTPETKKKPHVRGETQKPVSKEPNSEMVIFSAHARNAMPLGRFFDDLVLSKVILGAGWAAV
ncbi:MAG: hypothetical protein ACKVIK_13725 [Rhodospirillales bacterium]